MHDSIGRLEGSCQWVTWPEMGYKFARQAFNEMPLSVSYWRRVSWCSIRARLVEHQPCDSTPLSLYGVSELLSNSEVGFAQHRTGKRYHSCLEINDHVSDLNRDIICEEPYMKMRRTVPQGGNIEIDTENLFCKRISSADSTDSRITFFAPLAKFFLTFA